jgi:LCP family protein required for cell wall assembly
LRRVLKWLSLSLAVVLVISVVGGYLLYRHLSGNIAHAAIQVVGPRPTQAADAGQSENILLMGSDTRDFKGGAKFGADVTGARSDTTIIVHLYADGQHAVLVSIPRDTYTHIPRCKLPDHQTTDAQWNKFNAAFAFGGPSCTIATVEHMTGLYINHFVEVNFAGFQRMVDALHGVPVCLHTAIDDPFKELDGHIVGSGLQLSAGDHVLDGTQALAFVRARYGVGDGSDLGRIKDQQLFLSSMIRKATSTGLLLHPLELYRFLDAATKSIETDPGFGLSQLKSLASRVHGLKPGAVQLLTVPLKVGNFYTDIGGIPASVVYWNKPQADAIWQALEHDQPLPFTATHPGNSDNPRAPRPQPSSTVGPTPSPTPTLDVVNAAQDRCTA